MDKRRFNLILIALILTVILGGLIFWQPVSKPPSVNVVAEPSPSPETVTEGIAADGQISLKLNQKPVGDKITWSLSINTPNSAFKEIWYETLPDSVNFSIPFNTVSPDNKHLFIKEIAPDKTLYLIFATDGKPLNNASQMIEFTGLFAAKYPDLKITEATGWAAPYLIVFNTDKASGAIGPSFWFDVSSQSFIQLSNRFN